MAAHAASLLPTELQLALRQCRKAFSYAAVFSLCINLLTVLFSIYSMQVLDRVFSSHSYETLGMLSVLMAFAVLFLGFFTCIRSVVLDRSGAWLDRTLSPVLFARAMRLTAAGTPTAASQQQRDLGAIRQFITGFGITTLFDAPWTVVYLLVTFAISPPLGWLALVGCVLLIGLGIITEAATKKPLEQAGKASLETLNFVDLSARQAETIEAMGMTPAVLSRWQGPFAKVQGLQETASARSALLQSVTKMVRMALQIAVTGIGAYLVLERELTSGGMIAASILAARAFAPFENAIALWKQMIVAREAHKRLNAAIAQPLKPRGEMALPVPRGALSVEQMSYQPAHAPKAVLRGVSFTLQAGESLGIIGPSGAGKSTLARLLTGVIAPSAGAARLDGNDLATWGREDLGKYLGYVPQQVELFSGTIRDNIARMQINASPELVIEAAQMAGVHALIQSLPLGYDTPWSAQAPSLSPGQKQRIALARAVYGNPCFVILDEPNLNLDGEGEAALAGLLQQLKLKRVSVVMVAHKPSLIQHVDKILVLNQGAVEQFGAREQLLQQFARPAGVKLQ